MRIAPSRPPIEITNRSFGSQTTLTESRGRLVSTVHDLSPAIRAGAETSAARLSWGSDEDRNPLPPVGLRSLGTIKKPATSAPVSVRAIAARILSGFAPRKRLDFLHVVALVALPHRYRSTSSAKAVASQYRLLGDFSSAFNT